MPVIPGVLANVFMHGQLLLQCVGVTVLCEVIARLIIHLSKLH